MTRVLDRVFADNQPRRDHDAPVDHVGLGPCFPPGSKQLAYTPGGPDLVARCQVAPRCRQEILGRTLDGRDLDLLQIGEPGEGKRSCWVIARQHPGESMAEWLMEGLLARLLDDQDPVARELLNRAVFYAVPNMNPDGSTRGHLRTNACGANLNREWETPTMYSMYIEPISSACSLAACASSAKAGLASRHSDAAAPSAAILVKVEV